MSDEIYICPGCRKAHHRPSTYCSCGCCHEFSQMNRSTVSDYNSELSAWKAKHGIDSNSEINQDELRMLAEEQAAKGKSWCFYCQSYLPIRQMKLITRRIDPYTQCYEGDGDYIPKRDRVRMCPKCFKEKYPENDGTEAP